MADASNEKQIKQRVHLTNNFVVFMKGPAKSIVNGAMHVTEALAKSYHVSDLILETVQRGLIKQNETLQDRNNNDPVNCAFVEITSDWIYEGKNPDKGFSSNSIWMHDPTGERILIKNQDLLICAANEWLAYAIGKELDLPINKVQIGIYENNLITLHFDVNNGNEQTFTLNQLPKRRRQRLMRDPIIGAMDLFDRLIQNVDRNPLNILITIPNSAKIDDETTELKVHFVDHGACFGMGKRNGLSIFASKLHTNHVSVAKFHPAHESRKFNRYLNRLSSTDRILLARTINRLAAITNQQIDQWLSVVESFLTSTQYNRIHSVLYYQRDIAKRYVIQWDIDQSTSKSDCF